MNNVSKSKNLISFVLLYHSVKFEKNITSICNKIKKNFSNINYEILLVKNKEYTFPYKKLNNPHIRHIEIMSNYLYDIRIFGFKSANAKYVHSFDVDNDYCFKTIVNNLEIVKEGKYDILSFCRSSYNAKKLLKTDFLKLPEEISEVSFEKMASITLCWSNKLVKKSLENRMISKFKITYDEDILAFVQMNKKDLKILHINQPLSIILHQENSIARTYTGLQMESIKVNKYLKTITTPESFQLCLFKYVCSQLIDIKLIDDRKIRNENYSILKKYINENYNKKIINKIFTTKKERSVIIFHKAWFISMITFLVPRFFLKKLVLKTVKT